MKKIFAFLSLTFAAQSAQANGGDTSLQQIRDTLANYSERIYALETQVKVYAEFLNNVEGIMAVVTGLLVIMSVLQYFQTRSERKSNDDALQKYQTTLEKIEDKNNALLETVRKNIAQTTGFISSYENLLKIRSDALNIQEKWDKLEEKGKMQQENLVLAQKEINKNAMRQIYRVYRAFGTNFGSTYFNKYWKDNFELFSVAAKPHIPLKENRETEQNLNADVYFLLGLRCFLTGQSKDAEEYFDSAAKKSENFISSLPENTDILFPEKDAYENVGGIKEWNEMLANQCAFFRGLNKYRLGQFKDAAAHFDVAFRYASNDIDSKFYLHQSRFWGEMLISLSNEINDMNLIKNIIQNLSDKDDESKKMLLARLYLKMADFCMHAKTEPKFDKNIGDAVMYYAQSYQSILEINGDLKNIPIEYGHLVPMVYFRFAIALKRAAEQNIVVDPSYPPIEGLIKDAAKTCKKIINNVENPETRFILFYILSKCQQELGKTDDAIDNIDEADRSFKEYCSNPDYWGYSPVNNIMMRRDELSKEINDYKQSLVS